MPSLGESINSAISQANYQDKDMLMLIAILQAITEAGKGVGDYFGMRRAQKRFAWEEADRTRRIGIENEQLAYEKNVSRPRKEEEYAAWRKAREREESAIRAKLIAEGRLPLPQDADEELRLQVDEYSRQRATSDLSKKQAELNLEMAQKNKEEFEREKLAELIASGKSREYRGPTTRLSEALKEDPLLSTLIEQKQNVYEANRMKLETERMRYEGELKSKKQQEIYEKLMSGEITREEALGKSREAVTAYDKFEAAIIPTQKDEISTLANITSAKINTLRASGASELEAAEERNVYVTAGKEMEDNIAQILSDAPSHEKGIQKAVTIFKQAAKTNPALFSKYVADMFSTLGEKAGLPETLGVQNMLTEEFKSDRKELISELSSMDQVMYRLASDPDLRPLFKKEFISAFVDQPSVFTSLYGARRDVNVPAVIEQIAAEADYGEDIEPIISSLKDKDLVFRKEQKITEKFIPGGVQGLARRFATSRLEAGTWKNYPPETEEARKRNVDFMTREWIQSYMTDPNRIRTEREIAIDTQDKTRQEINKQLEKEATREFYAELLFDQLAKRMAEQKDALPQKDYYDRNFKRP